MYRCAQSARHTAQSDHFSSREHAWLKIASLGVQNMLSPSRHVSFFAAPDTDHQHKLFLTNFSNLTVILSYTPKPVDSRSMYTLRRFTAELRFLGSPVSHTNECGQSDNLSKCSVAFRNDLTQLGNNKPTQPSAILSLCTPSCTCVFCKLLSPMSLKRNVSWSAADSSTSWPQDA